MISGNSVADPSHFDMDLNTDLDSRILLSGIVNPGGSGSATLPGNLTLPVLS